MKDSHGQKYYNVHARVLNASYYGLPQARERLFIIALRRSKQVAPFKFPSPWKKKVKLSMVVNKKFCGGKKRRRSLVFNKQIEFWKMALDSTIISSYYYPPVLSIFHLAKDFWACIHKRCYDVVKDGSSKMVAVQNGSFGPDLGCVTHAASDGCWTNYILESQCPYYLRVVDVGASKKFQGKPMLEICPTLTKTRASGKGFWLTSLQRPLTPKDARPYLVMKSFSNK